MDLVHLLDLVRMGDYVASLLKDALDHSGLNLTQARICWQLHEHSRTKGLKQVPQSLTELSRKLGASPARVQIQLKQLQMDDLVQAVRREADADQRVQRYILSSKGRRQARIFIDHARVACGVLWAEAFAGTRERSDFNAWSRVFGRLSTSMERISGRGARL